LANAGFLSCLAAPGDGVCRILLLTGEGTCGQNCADAICIDTPDAQTIEEQIVTAVLDEVCQYFDFDGEA
jgi:hypothetical protein